MKNVSEHDLKTCIFKIIDDFKEDLHAIWGKNIEFHCDLDGMSVLLKEKDEFLEDEELYSKLSEYYDANVTSIHIDDCFVLGVWIVYKEK